MMNCQMRSCHQLAGSLQLITVYIDDSLRCSWCHPNSLGHSCMQKRNYPLIIEHNLQQGWRRGEQRIGQKLGTVFDGLRGLLDPRLALPSVLRGQNYL